ncbi:MAG: amidohydrolase family protein [Candidatus Micrarchaeota archaeon]|nr:amidohydrolase family protein [Candidatus Micrarchaeota archaeon]
MVIDIHTHTGNKPIRSTLNDIAASMKAYGIDKSAVSPMRQPSSSMLIAESKKNLSSNDARFLCFLRFDPNRVHVDELMGISNGFDGFKLHPRSEKFNPLDKKFKGMFRFFEDAGKPVLIHSRKEDYPYSDPVMMLKLAKRYAGTNFIFGHFASDSDRFFDDAYALDNVFVDTSIVSSPKIIEFRVDSFGADRMLFGSDFPFSDQEIELLKIKKAGIKDSQKDMILHSNAARLLSI